MNSCFAQFLKEKIDSLTGTQTQAFRSCLASQCGERCLTKSFNEKILQRIQGVSDIRKPKFETNSRQISLFGYTQEPDDLELLQGNQRILLECKVVRTKKECEARNGFGQLLEYLLLNNWNEGCLILFDVRDNPSDFFDEASELGQYNCWFARKFTFSDAPLTHMKNISFSVLHIYLNSSEIKTESWVLPISNATVLQTEIEQPS